MWSTFFTFGAKHGNIFHPSPKVTSSEGSSSEMLFDSNSTGIPWSHSSVVAPPSLNLCLRQTHIHDESTKMCQYLLYAACENPTNDTRSASLVLRPHPAHARRRVWCHKSKSFGQLQKHGAANEIVIGIMRKQEQVLQSYCSKHLMRFIIQHWPICNSTLTVTKL